ncbi:MAG: hypothetical protein ACPL4I_12520, partial [Bacteroidota bacterium]
RAPPPSGGGAWQSVGDTGGSKLKNRSHNRGGAWQSVGDTGCAARNDSVAFSSCVTGCCGTLRRAQGDIPFYPPLAGSQ